MLYIPHVRPDDTLYVVYLNSVKGKAKGKASLATNCMNLEHVLGDQTCPRLNIDFTCCLFNVAEEITVFM